jgi:hypothetical protein
MEHVDSGRATVRANATQAQRKDRHNVGAPQ